MFRKFIASPLLILQACGAGSGGSQPAPPATTALVAHEPDLLRITLTPDARQRLGIATSPAKSGIVRQSRLTTGEIVAPNVRGGVPTGSLSNLSQIGASQAAADGEVTRTRAQEQLAKLALRRAEQLVAEEAGSVRARDEAAAALAAAQAQSRAAAAQRSLLGPAVSRLEGLPALWVRIPVFGTDASAVAPLGLVTVAHLDGRSAARSGRAVQAPPSSNMVAGTVDHYFAIDNRDRAYRIGQRVSAQLPLKEAGEGVTVPASAILRDIYGGEWVYVQTAPNNFLRKRVEIASSRTNEVVLSRGLRTGAAVVTTGAMELYGTEFGVAH